MQNNELFRMDPIFETMGLLLVSYNYEEVKDQIKKGFSDNGMDGEQAYLQHFRVYDKYVQTFLKHRVESTEDKFFFDENDSNYHLILLVLILENKSWLESSNSMSSDIVRAQIIDKCKAVFDEEADVQGIVPGEDIRTERAGQRKGNSLDIIGSTEDSNQEIIESNENSCTKGIDSVEKGTTHNLYSLEGIIQYLDSSPLEPDAKWKVLRIMQNPVSHISQLIKIVNSNLGAYQKAVSEIRRPLEKMVNKFNDLEKSDSGSMFYGLKNEISKTSIVYPTLIFPVSQMIFEQYCYYGLLSDKLTEKKRNQNSKEQLLIKLKALSDGSKLGIISSLKVSPKYNLEIAQQLGLTAATMSHHMSVLLNCGLVGVEKREGKVYYHIERQNLQELINELEETLL